MVRVYILGQSLLELSNPPKSKAINAGASSCVVDAIELSHTPLPLHAEMEGEEKGRGPNIPANRVLP